MTVTLRERDMGFDEALSVMSSPESDSRQPPMLPISPGGTEFTIGKPRLSSVALYGPLGEWVKLVSPHTEASPPALLMSAMATTGTMIGRGPSVTLDGARHGTNFFVALVGGTSTGRKGTASAQSRRLGRELDPDFTNTNCATGLSSGQGVVFCVRDARQTPDGEKVMDPGVVDKRLLIEESEFAGALRQARGRENTMTAVLRRAWDGDSLRTLTKGDPLKATDPHISIIAQITPDELRALLDGTDFSSGFINRFLITYSERARLLPFGSVCDKQAEREVVDRMRSAISTARLCGNLDEFTPAAREWWADAYPRLTEGRSGRIGAATQRAAAHVRRIALMFAALDGARRLDLPQLEAAGAVWNYADASARYVFGSVDLTPRARKVAAGLLDAGRDGLDRSLVRDQVLGSHNIPARELDTIEAELTDAGLLDVSTAPTAGRSRTVWTHRSYGQDGQHGQEESGNASLLPISPTVQRLEEAGGYEEDERKALAAGL